MYKDDITRVKHMLDSTNEALSFIKSKDRKDLDKERMLVLSLDKVVRNFMVIVLSSDKIHY